MIASEVPTIIKPGLMFTTSWSNNKFHSWKLVDVTNNQAYLQRKNGEIFQTHVNNLRTPQKRGWK